MFARVAIYKSWSNIFSIFQRLHLTANLRAWLGRNSRAHKISDILLKVDEVNLADSGQVYLSEKLGTVVPTIDEFIRSVYGKYITSR